MSNDAEVRARWSAVLDAQTNADFLTSYTIGADELRALVRIAAEARSHDGEWEAMRSGLEQIAAKAADFKDTGWGTFSDGYGSAIADCAAIARQGLSAVPLFDEGRL